MAEFIIKHLQGEDFAIFVGNGQVFLPVDLGLLSGSCFKSGMPFLKLLWNKFVPDNIFIEIRIGPDPGIHFGVNELINSPDSGPFYQQFFCNEFPVSIQPAGLCMGGRFPFISVIVFFDSSSVIPIQPCELGKVGFYFTQL